MTAPARPVRVAYVMSRFPKLSETFVVSEMLGVEAEGVEVEVFPLIRERERLQQPEATALVERSRFQPFLSPAIVASLVAWVFEAPGTLFGAVAEAVRGVWRNGNFLLGLLGVLPKTLHNARVMRRLGVDHIHAHFGHHPALSALIIHRLTGIPFSFTGHGHDIQVDRRMLCGKIAAARFAVAVSEFNRGLMTDECPSLAATVDVVHTGVDPTALAPGPATPWAENRWADPRHERLRILAVGRLEPVKGHEVLLDALALLGQRGVAARCLIVGEGPRRDALERQHHRLSLGDDLRLDGSWTRAQVLDLMRSADVVALPSVVTDDGRVEGIPVVLMEAMSVGTPVVASDLPGVRELVSTPEQGIRVPSGDGAALADALTRMTDGDLRARLAAEGRRRIIDAFDARTTCRYLAGRFAASATAASTRPGEHTR